MNELRAEDYRYALRILRYTVRRHSASPTLSRSKSPGFPANRACRESYRWREKLMSSKEQSCARGPADGVLSQHWHSLTAQSLTAQFRNEYSLPLQAQLWKKSEREQKLLQHHDATLHDIAVIAPLWHHRNRQSLSSVHQG